MDDNKKGKTAKNLSRRDALALLGTAGAGALLNSLGSPIAAAALPQEPGFPLMIAGERAELRITVVNPRTLRISVLPVQKDGSVLEVKASAELVERNWPEPAEKIRTLGRPQPRGQFRGQSIPFGDLQVRVLPEPLTIFVQGRRGRIIPRLRFDADDASVSFDRGVAPAYGLGEGGPQFDRGGQDYPMRNGQGMGLDVLGARMPIPWVVGGIGWGLFFHRPYGTFDLRDRAGRRSEEHTSELQSQFQLVCRLLLEKKNSRAAMAVR